MKNWRFIGPRRKLGTIGENRCLKERFVQPGTSRSILIMIPKAALLLRPTTSNLAKSKFERDQEPVATPIGTTQHTVNYPEDYGLLSLHSPVYEALSFVIPCEEPRLRQRGKDQDQTRTFLKISKLPTCQPVCLCTSCSSTIWSEQSRHVNWLDFGFASLVVLPRSRPYSIQNPEVPVLCFVHLLAVPLTWLGRENSVLACIMMFIDHHL
ncbi:hypothetical protein B0T13DRAFT_298808 [Neurospora crassa]|nr:hypothetical protein B0T13DRAFT_298808 [Neurospora crassa]